MEHFEIDQNLIQSILTRLIEKGCSLSLEELATMVDIVKEEVLFRYVDRLISQIEMVIEINPSLNEKRDPSGRCQERGGISGGGGGQHPDP